MRNPLIQTLADIPEFHAHQHPQKISLVYGASQVSFEQLDRRSNQLANALCSEGLEPQANIAFMDRNSEHFFYILFGASKANTSLVTVNFRLTENEIAYILDDAEAELIFVGREYLESVVNCQSQLSRLKKIIVIDSDDGAIHERYSSPVQLS